MQACRPPASIRAAVGAIDLRRFALNHKLTGGGQTTLMHTAKSFYSDDAARPKAVHRRPPRAGRKDPAVPNVLPLCLRAWQRLQASRLPASARLLCSRVRMPSWSSDCDPAFVV